MSGSTDQKLKEFLSDIIAVDNVLLIVKSNGATSEMRSNSLSKKQKDRGITIGDNNDPCHMHVKNNMIKKAKFIMEERPERISFSVGFLMRVTKELLHAFLQKCTTKKRTFWNSERRFMIIC